MNMTAKFRMGSWSANLTATSHALAGALGAPLAFGSVFALALAPMKRARTVRLTERHRYTLKRAA